MASGDESVAIVHLFMAYANNVLYSIFNFIVFATSDLKDFFQVSSSSDEAMETAESGETTPVPSVPEEEYFKQINPPKFIVS